MIFFKLLNEHFSERPIVFNQQVSEMMKNQDGARELRRTF